MAKIILKIEGMTCSACSNHVEKYLSKQKGIIDVSVNLVLGQALIYYEDNITLKDLEKYINDSGYKYAGIYDELEETKKDNSLIYLIILGIILAIFMFLNMHFMTFTMAMVSFLLSLIYLFYGCDILIKGFKNLFLKAPNMDSLVTLGVTVSFIYSLVNLILLKLGHDINHNLYFESVCMIIYFLKLGRYIDKNSKEKTKEALKELVQVTPSSAILKKGHEEIEVTIDEVQVNDILIVKPGMKVAVDGQIIEGSAHFDESFITGEARPVKKSVNDNIMAGSINYDGIVLYKALKIGVKSTISEMIHLVLEASNSKPPISRLADKVSSYFVPSILIIALLTFITYLIKGFSFNIALIHLVTVLVVACPCALGLATPLAIVVALGTAAKHRLLIKSSETLEIAAHLDTIIFDKTGTLTYGKLRVSKIYNYSSYKQDDLLNLVANLESNSTHPIAKAFSTYKHEDLKIKDYQELAGIGLSAKINGKQYYLGNAKILKNIANPYKTDADNLTLNGNSIIYVVENQKIIGLIGIKDIIRKDAKKTIKDIKNAGLQVFMLTGDNENTAQRISEELDIDNVLANVMPKDKTEFIKDLQKKGHTVAMVGDGINDAPALTTADIGMSLQGSTDIATNTANVIITGDKLTPIVTFLNLSHKTLRNIKQNLFWAFFYNILMIPLAMGLFKNWGLEISPMFASMAMMLSSLCVVFNALRLKK